MKIRKVKSLRTKKIITLCYGRTGERLFRGYLKDLPEHLKNYYISDMIVHKDRIYLEAVEDKEWFYE